MRTYFQENSEGELRQFIIPAEEIKFEVNYKDVSLVGVLARNSIVDKHFEYTFDLSNAPLLHIEVIKYGTNKHLLLFNMHHIISDGWSLEVLSKEIILIYNALLKNAPIPLQPLAIQYKDYTLWKKSDSEQAKLKKSEDYWLQHLAGELPVLDLPAPKKRPKVKTYHGAAIEHRFSGEFTDSLVSITKQEGTSIFMGLLAGLNGLFCRYTQATDIVLGTAVSGREHADLAGQIGLYLNTLPIRTQVNPKAGFRDLLIRQKNVMLNAYSHQAYPFDALIENLNIKRDTSRSALFDVFVILQNQKSALGSSELTFESLKVKPFEAAERKKTSQFDITFSFTELQEGLSVLVEYNTDIYDKAFISQLIVHFENFVLAAVSAPQKPIALLNYLSEAEKLKLLKEFNNTQLDYAHHLTVLEDIEEQVQRNPKATALAFSDLQISFEDLNRQSDLIAGYLRAQGVQQGTVVGLCVDRSVEMIVGIIGILKAGAVYLPLDPTYPIARLDYIVQDSGASYILAKKGADQFLTAAQNILCFEDIDQTEQAHFELPRLNTQSPAYLIYTSGSTGKPKGVQVSHRNLANFFAGLNQSFPQAKKDEVWLAVTSMSFDISILEMLWTLTRGSKVVIQPDRPSSLTVAESMDFSLFYFASQAEVKNENKYKLLLEGAKFADKNGLHGIWVPERHFHDFGDQFPNPAIAAAAVAATTSNITIRSGSVVLPLHNTIRVAEDWAMIDNLSEGRVELSIASGWHPNDFVLAPENYEKRHEVMRESIETLSKLWQGGTLVRKNGIGQDFEFKIHPTPVQEKLPIWITAARSIDTFEYAGSIGGNVLTHLLGQEIEDLTEKINAYRNARKDNGFDPDAGKVALMLHTFVSNDAAYVKEMVEEPFKDYLRQSINLMQTIASDAKLDIDKDLNVILDLAFKRYYTTSGLFGTPEGCLSRVKELYEVGVNEVACLLDFGINNDVVLENLVHLKELNKLVKRNKAQYQYLAIRTKGSKSPAQIIQAEQVTHLQSTPSFYKELMMTAEGTKSVGQLQTLLTGGEELSQSFCQELLQLREKPVYNMYGPTETTIWSTMKKISKTEELNIGKPLANTQVYILDEIMQLCPVGVHGELYIGGEGVALGYLNKYELNAERFVDNPFSDENSSSKIYKTGDLARWLPNGELEYLGRIDNQVKLRGHRIELGEIENVFRKKENILDVAVDVTTDATGEKELTAYLVAQTNENTGSLRGFLQNYLPAYMIPNRFVHVSKLPLTPNGKLDRIALTKLTGETMAGNQEYQPATTPTEEALVEIWEQVLKRERVGVLDNFFELGGHSLLAVRVLSAIKSRLAAEVSITDMFDYPTIQGLAGLIESQAEQGELQVVSKQELPADIPLSFAQERLWFIDRLRGSEHYHLPVLLKLHGKLNLDYLSQALKGIIERHEILRTVYVEKEGVAYQQVLSAEGWGLSYRESGPDYQEYVQAQVHEPFNLAKDYMLRATVLKLSAEEHVLVLVRHHIASDGWSASVLVQEFSELYAALEEEREAVLPELAFQYVDYAVWQRRHQGEEVLSAQLDYWQNQLSGTSPLNLPTDYVRPATQSSRGNRARFKLDREKTESLRSLSQGEGVTLFMLLLGVYKVLLYRYSGQQDICVGTTVANRPQKELENLIGFFVNTLALRSDLSGNPSFRELLSAVKQTTLGAYDHINVPFEKVVDRVDEERDKSRSSLFQTLFVLNNNPEAKVYRFGDISIEPLDMDYNIAKFDLTLFAEDSPEGLVFSLNYCSDLFAPETIERLSLHYQALLDAVLADASVPVSQLRMLSEQERRSLVVDSNQLPYHYQSQATVSDLFQARVQAQPDAEALRYNNTSLTYRELDEQATRLAAYYQQTYQLQANDLIGIMMDSSPWALLAIVSVIKSGAGYVPIDPALPEERRAYIIEETGLKALIIDSSSLMEVFNVQVPVFSIDIQSEDLPAVTEPLQEVADPSSLLYVIYTSGTTGQPKGVQVSHENLVDYYQGLLHATKLEENKSFGLMSALSADLGHTVLYGSLLSGGCLHLFSKDTLMDGLKLQAYFAQHPIDCIKIVPSHWQALSAEGELLLPRRTLIFGGDVLPASVVTTIHAQEPQLQLYNHYGPTESTVGKLLHAVERGRSYERVPLGQLFCQGEAYVVGSDMSLCPSGVAGELLLGGAGISPGYLKRPDLTAEKFIANPFGEGGSSRLYRSGDLVRRNQHGELEFLGRVDDQVKVRGYRVELKEISRAIEGYESVSANVVVLKESDGLARLVAYVVPKEGYQLEELSAYLSTKLPDYMQPQAYVALEALPLTANGKVDRKALPDPTQQKERPYQPATSPVEEALVEIWEQVLRRERVGVLDNFFELGGHSLLAVRVLSAIKSRLAAEVSITDMFDYPTIQGLAGLIESQAEQGELQVVSKQELPADIPLSFAQERLWFIDRLRGSEHYHLPVLLKLHGKLNLDYLSQALKGIIERHEILRTVYVEKEGVAYQQVLSAEGWGLSYRESGPDYQEYVQAQVHEPFNLAKDYMLRATVLKLSAEEHVLVLVRHHIASDGWSASVLVQEFSELYAALEEEREAVLPELAFQYVDYAVWQRRHQGEEVLSAQLDYWQNQLSGTSPLNLPTDYVRPATQSSRGNRARFKLDREKTESLRSLSQGEGVTLFMLLLGVYKVLLYRYSGQQDICVGTTVANRPQKELENLIGFFVNTLALRSDLSGNPSFRELLSAVKQTTLGAYDHINVPFEKVVDRVDEERDKSRSSLFQTLFVLNNNPEAKVYRFGDISIEPLDMDYNIAKFDLTLFAEDSPEGLVFSLNYCSDLFAPETIERLSLHYQALLDAVLADASVPVSQLRMLSEQERRSLVVDSNQLPYHYQSQATVSDLFQARVQAQPDAEALRYNNTSLTYRELDEQATRLAAYYQQTYQLQANDLIGIMMDSSPWALLAIVSVIKSGAGYVPIDPALPEERRAYIIEETGLKALIIDSSSLMEVFNVQVPVFSIDIQSEDLPAVTEPLQEVADPSSLLYVIYTSGTTGQPKGVQVSHENLVDYYQGLLHATKLEENKSFGLMSALSADLGHTVLYGSLLSGGCLHLFSKDTLMDGLKLQAYFAQHPIDCIKIVPSHWQALSAEGELLLPRRTLIFGGDVLPASVVTTIHAQEPQLQLYNHYGPTESTVGKLLHAVERGRSYERVPLGQLFCQGEAYVVGSDMSLCPSGVAGELLLGGAGISPGYLKRPDLTAEKFIANPFGEGGSSRLYRSGDLVRRNQHGELEFLGRVDDQVKVRGYRVELKEISRAIEGYESVSANVVVLKESDGLARLVAYVVPKEGYQLEELSAYLSTKLPDYMQPQAYVALEALPLTANGKVDRKALPDPTQQKERPYQPATSPVEEALVEIWTDLLRADKVGVADNFFELGGDSIIIIQVVSRAKKKGFILQVQDLFDYQTIQELAQVIESSKHATIDAEQGLLYGEVKLSPIQNWFFNKDVSNYNHFNQTVLLSVEKSIQEEKLESAINSIIQRHDSLRLKYSYQNIHNRNVWTQEYSSEPQSVFSLQEISNDNFTSDSITAICEKYQQALKLEDGKLCQFVLIRTPEDEAYNRLLIVVHHLAIDGVSWRVLLDDLEGLIGDTLEVDILENKTSSFRDWVDRLQEFADSEEVTSQLAYWQQVAESYLPIKTDFEAVKPTRKSLQTASRTLNADYTDKLLTKVNKVYNTDINDILLSALLISLSENHDTDTLTVGFEGHGRDTHFEGIDVSGTTGWFTNKYPVVLSKAESIESGDIVKDVKETLRAVPQKGIGYGCLKYLNSDASVRQKLENSTWDVVFNYLGQLDNAISTSRYFKEAKEYPGAHISPEFDMPDKFVIKAMITANKLKISWDYSNELYTDETVQRLISGYVSSLEALIEHCLAKEESELTPSDFGFAGSVDHKEFEELFESEDSEEGVLKF